MATEVHYGHCAGCKADNVPIKDDHQPGPLCRSCVERIKMADYQANSLRGIRQDMRAFGIPMRNPVPEVFQRSLFTGLQSWKLD